MIQILAKLINKYTTFIEQKDMEASQTVKDSLPAFMGKLKKEKAG